MENKDEIFTFTVYRLFYIVDGEWMYHNYNFIDMEEAEDYAMKIKMSGIIEEWIVEQDEEYEDILLEKQCVNYSYYDYKDIKPYWEFTHAERVFPTPGYVFNYYRRYVDEFIPFEDVVDLIIDDFKEKMVA